MYSNRTKTARVKQLFILFGAMAALSAFNFRQAGAQEKPRFWDAVQEFKKQDSLQAPPSDAILFIGSSSFTRWKDVQDYFPGYTIINRGFGGSILLDQIRYAGDIIFPYNPKQIVIYCGENDLNRESVDAETTVKRFKQLFHLIRGQLPDVNIVFISMKPSPSRQHLMLDMLLANERIRCFLKGQENTGYVDVYHSMLTEDKLPMPDIFVSDELHMNEKGYAIWKEAIEPFLLK